VAGYGSPIAAHWHQGSKSFFLEGGPPGFQPTGITALSPTDVWVFGGTGHWAGPFWMLHFRAGKWSRVGLTSRVYRVALIPGTTSLWRSGEILRKSSATGTIWAHGRLG
jgi:hypothetical protein